MFARRMLGLFGCFSCLFLASVAHADGRVFVVELNNSSSLPGFQEAERACASQQARLASAAELRHAVAECFFSLCTHGWLHGGTVGTTVCNYVGGSLKAVDVRTENATGDATQSSGFCIKDKGVPCGDPPSFPNARLQDHSGFELGDELLYSCVPGYVMPNGHSAFSLLCDSCGEWYGLVQICVKDSTEGHMDYEDKFSYAEEEHQSEDNGPVEVHGRVYEEVHGETQSEEPRGQELEEMSFTIKGEETEDHGQQEVEVDIMEEQDIEDSAGHQGWEDDKRETTTTTTEAPVSLVSQKHRFWFPSEAFQQQEEHLLSVDHVTQIPQRPLAGQSEESSVEHHGNDDQQGQAEQDVTVEELDDHHDHYDMGEHEEERVHYDDRRESDEEPGAVVTDGHHVHPEGSEEHPDQEDRDDHDNKDQDDHDDHFHHVDHDDDHDHHDDRDNPEDDDNQGDLEDREGHDEHEDHEDHEDQEDHDEHEDPDDQEDHENRDDHDNYFDPVDPDEHVDHDDQDHHKDRYGDTDDQDDFDNGRRDDNDSYDHHDSHEDDHEGDQRVVFSKTRERTRNTTQEETGQVATTDDTWLDGHPVAGEDVARETAARATHNPNEVGKNIPEEWETPVPDNPASSSDSASSLEYDTQQVVPTHSWLLNLTQHPFIHHDPAHDDTVEHTPHRLPGETGERGQVEGEAGETICVGESCPPAGTKSRGPTVAAIIAAVCLVAAAIVVAVWCYRRRQQKSSVYEMNGKGQSQSNQQMEMQQKV
ncbi:sushi domain-containing protein 5 isoform X1 [Nerophis ophidion]|uniref:sushi domain-containing protein 5 isoform X1 n=1 Tax=Nerophis ophidion TaxID=159077 RepID=UPI002ADFA3C1|nr:sushi domain-containing protein 5 isoform X1 [Nerophis ophidion]